MRLVPTTMLLVLGVLLAVLLGPGCGGNAPVAPGPPRVVSGSEALGGLDELPARQQRAFAVTEAFPPMPRPGPHDWLTINPEAPQTVTDYLAAEPVVPTAPRNVIYVLPLGPMPAERGPTLDELSSYAHAFFGLSVSVLPTVDPSTLDVRRRVHHDVLQLHATDILDWMESRIPDDAYCVIAVTWLDLYPDETYNFVFGLARQQVKVGVFGFARLHPDFYAFGELPGPPARPLVVQRALAVMSHEIGHMFGLDHCVFFGCNMNGSNSLEEADRQPMHVCPVCLRKLHAVLGFDPEARYEALEGFYAEAGLQGQAAWVKAQRQHIAGASP